MVSSPDHVGTGYLTKNQNKKYTDEMYFQIIGPGPFVPCFMFKNAG
jgi:hypothetical protein